MLRGSRPLRDIFLPSLNVIFEIVLPFLLGQIPIGKQDLPNPIRVLDGNRLTLS